MQELRDIRAKTEKGKQSDAIILPQHELDQIKKNMIYKSPEKIVMEKKLKET